MTESNPGPAVPGADFSAAPGQLVAGQYRLLREIGRGGMGVVWLAEDELLARQVAVKELRPPRGLTDDDSQARLRERALREARNAARIRHPNAVAVYNVVPPNGTDDAVYLIMEFVDGATLAQAIARQGALPAAWVRAVGLQMLDVLQAAHALGIVHRDVKPGNILLTDDGQAKLTDFGIAHSAEDLRLTTEGVVMGTGDYLAPEALQSGPITPAADLWSLGATLYHAADGRSPFHRDSTVGTLGAILFDPVPKPRCDPGIAAAIDVMLRRDPRERATIDQARVRLLGRGTPRPSAPGPLPGRAAGAPPVVGAVQYTASDHQAPPFPPSPGPDVAPPAGRPPRRRRLGRRETAAVGAGILAAAGVAIALIAMQPPAGSGPALAGNAGASQGSSRSGTSSPPYSSPPVTRSGPPVTRSGPPVTRSGPPVTRSSPPVSGAPPAPVDLRASADDEGDINVSWKAPGPGLWYYVHYEDTSVARPVWASYLDTKTTAQLQDLTVGHKIAIYVTAVNQASRLSPPTATVYAEPYVPRPPAPQGLTAVGSNAEVDLSWDAVTGTWDGELRDAYYFVYYRNVTTGGAWTTYYCGTGAARGRCPDTKTSFQATFLTNGDHYQFYVEATDPGGTSVPSKIVDATPVA